MGDLGETVLAVPCEVCGAPPHTECTSSADGSPRDKPHSRRRVDAAAAARRAAHPATPPPEEPALPLGWQYGVVMEDGRVWGCGDGEDGRARQRRRLRYGRVRGACLLGPQDVPEHPSFESLVQLARDLLDENYPVDTMRAMSQDPGPAFTLALREALDALDGP